MENEIIIVNNRVDQKALKFIMAAMSYDDSKAFMRCIIVEDGWCMCTDRHRLHAARLRRTDVPDGVYRVYSNPDAHLLLKCDIEPPKNLLKLLDAPTTPAKFYVNLSQNSGISEAIYHINRARDICVDFNYISDLQLAGVGFELSVELHDDNLGPVHFDADDFRAVIMPIKL